MEPTESLNKKMIEPQVYRKSQHDKEDKLNLRKLHFS